MNLKKQEIANKALFIISINKKIKKVKPTYEKNSSLFHSKKEVEELYQTLSQYAAVNGLINSKIDKKEPKPVRTTKITEHNNKELNKQNVGAIFAM